MTRAPMKLDLKKNQLHKDVGKAAGAKITEADIAKEKSKGGVYAKPGAVRRELQEVESPRKGETVTTGLACWVRIAGGSAAIGQATTTWSRINHKQDL